MTDELTLYMTDRPAWLKLVAPHMPAVIDANDDAQLKASWGLMARDFQAATWAQLSEAQRERVKRVRGVA